MAKKARLLNLLKQGEDQVLIFSEKNFSKSTPARTPGLLMRLQMPRPRHLVLGFVEDHKPDRMCGASF